MRIRINKSLTALSVLIFAAGTAWASSGEITVSGNMAPSRCEVIAPDNGVYDLGLISAREYSAGPIALPSVTRTWRVKCDKPTTLAVIPEDNRADSVHGIGNKHFGFGGDGEASLGYFELGISRVQTDQRAVMLQTAGGGISSMLPGIRSQWVTQDNIPQAGTIFDVDITVFPWLTPRTRMITDQAKFDGSVTLNFIFGL